MMRFALTRFSDSNGVHVLPDDNLDLFIDVPDLNSAVFRLSEGF